jgi:hypothetical protein
VSLIFHCVLNSKIKMFIINALDRHMHCWYCPTLILIESYTDSYCSVYDLYGGILHMKIPLLFICDIYDNISGSLDEDKLCVHNMINCYSYHN